MKNKRFEKFRISQKTYLRDNRPCFEGGIRVHHCYVEKKILSWWDDTGFILNGKYISVWWVHPRKMFSDALDNKAHENVPRVSKGKDWLLDDSKPTYKKVGKSRKKIAYYTLDHDPDNEGWFARLNAEKKRLNTEFDAVIKPSMVVESLSWCRGVEVCVPMEVHGVEDLKKLCVLVKRLLKGETTLDKEFHNYTYTKEDWAADTQLLESSGAAV